MSNKSKKSQGPKTHSNIPRGGVLPLYLVYAEETTVPPQKEKLKVKQEFGTNLVASFPSIDNILEGRRGPSVFADIEPTD